VVRAQPGEDRSVELKPLVGELAQNACLSMHVWKIRQTANQSSPPWRKGTEGQLCRREVLVSGGKESRVDS
jgi:hypothetical protein